MARLFPLLVAASLGLGLAAGLRGLDPSPAAFPVLLVLVAEAGLLAGGEARGRLRGLGRGALHGVAYGVLVLASGVAAGLLVAPAAGGDPGVLAATGAAGGWYSLVGPLVAERDPGMGLAALIANIAREAAHIALYPALARRGLEVEAVVLGGATTMDTGLPVVAAYGGARATVVAVAQGLTVTLTAPALLPWLLGG